MSKMKTTPVTLPLYGHGLECVGSISAEPPVTGSFAEETIIGGDGKEYALFTVGDTFPNQPSGWAGTYRISVDRLVACGPLDVFADE